MLNITAIQAIENPRETIKDYSYKYQKKDVTFHVKYVTPMIFKDPNKVDFIMVGTIIDKDGKVLDDGFQVYIDDADLNEIE